MRLFRAAFLLFDEIRRQEKPVVTPAVQFISKGYWKLFKKRVPLYPELERILEEDEELLILLG